MANEDRRKLFNAINKAGYDIGNYDDFDKRMNNAEDRQKFFKAVNDAGYDIGDQAEFERRISPSKYKLNIKGNEVPVSESEYMDFMKRNPSGKSKGMPSAENTIKKAYQTVDESKQGANRLLNREQRIGLDLPKGAFGRINVGENRKVTPGIDRFNFDKGQMEPTYITEAGNEYGNRGMADLEQNAVDDARRRELDPIGTELQDLYAEQDRLNKLLEARRQEIEQARNAESGMTSFLREAGRAAASGMLPDNTSPSLDLQNDRQYSDLMAAARQNKEAITTLEDQRDQRTNEFWHSLGTEISNGYNFSLGGKAKMDDWISEVEAQKHIDSINEKRAKGEQLTSEELTAEAVLKNKEWDREIQGRYGDDYGAWARAGKMGANSADFMLDFLLMGGAPANLAKGVMSAVVRGGEKYLGNLATKGFGRFMLKSLGATLGSMVAGAEITNTVQLGKTASDVAQSMLGDVYRDENGNYIFGHYEEDEDGNPKFVAGGNDFFSALAEAERTGISENGSEIMGTFLPGATNVLNQLGLSKIARGLTALKGKGWYQNYSKFLETAGFNGVVGEGLEEYGGMMLDAIMGGDEWKQLGEGRTHLDIWLGVATMSGILNAPKLIGTGVYAASQYQQYKHAVNKASIDAEATMNPQDWAVLRERIDGTDNENIADVTMSILDDNQLSDESKQAAMNYIKNLQNLRGFSLGSIIAGKEEGATNEVSQEMGNSYTEGYDTQDPNLRKQYNDDAIAAEQNLPKYGNEFAKMVSESENPVETLDYLMQNRDYYTDEQIEVAADYFQKKAAADGMMDGVLDQIDTQVEEAKADVVSRTHQQTGSIITAQYDGREYYVVGGDVVTDPNTGMPMLAGTGGAVVVKDAETGETSVMNPNDLTIGEMQSADELIQGIETNYRQQLMQQAEDDITFGAPANEIFYLEDTVTLTDGEGNVIEGQIGMLPNSVDGAYVVYTSDGKALQLTADDMNRRIVAHNGMEVQRESQPVAKDNLTTEQTEQPIEQNQPVVEQNQANLEQNQPETEQEEPQSALSRIPVKVDEKGNPFINKKGESELDWAKAPVSDTADAFAEMTDGNFIMARDTAKSMIENAKIDLEKANKLKTQGKDPISIIESRKANAQAVKQAQDVVKYWQDVYDEMNRRMKQAELDRKAAEEAAKTEEQRAAEAARQAEIAAKQAEIDAQRRREEVERQRKERNKPYAPLQRAKKDMAGYDEALAILDDAEPRDLPEWVSHLLRPHSLMWENEKVGESTVTGLQSELGLQKKDFDRIGTLLGKRSEGALPFAEVVDEIHEGLPEAMKEQFTDQDVRNALIDLFGEGDVNRMLHLAEEHRIEEAQLMVNELERRNQEAELDAWAEAYHLTPEERESFEAFMQEPPSEPEQEIINQIIAEYEQQSTGSKTLDQQSDVGTDGTENQGSQTEVQGEGAQEQSNADSTEQPAKVTEAGTGRQTVSDDNVSGGKPTAVKSVQDNLRQILADAYASGDAKRIATAAELIRNFILNDNDGFDGVYREDIDDYTGTDPEILAEQYIIHATQNYYLDDDEDQEFIRTGLRKDLREKIASTESKPSADTIKANLKVFLGVLGQKYGNSQMENNADQIVDNLNDTQLDQLLDLARQYERAKGNQSDSLYDTINDFVGTNANIPVEETNEAQSENITEQDFVEVVKGYLTDLNEGYVSPADVIDGVRDLAGDLQNGELAENMARALELTNEEDAIRAISQAVAFTQTKGVQPLQLGKTSSPEEIAAEEAKVNTEPTEAQKKAGNYQMGHIKVDGFDITIENPKGSIRSGVDQNGKAWSQEMHNNYGYIRGTEGTDGDHIDVFLSDYPDEGHIYVIDQVNPETGVFDEVKVLWGFDSVEEATEAYLSNYEEGWKGLGNINRVERSEFKKWIESSHRKTKPFADYKSVKKDEYTEAGEGVQTLDALDIPAEVKDQIAEVEQTLDNILKQPAVPEDEETKKKVDKLNDKLRFARRKLATMLRALTTKQLLELKDAYKDGGGIYTIITNEIRERQIAQQMADAYDDGAEKQQIKVSNKEQKPAKQEDYVNTNEKQPTLSGVYHDPDGYAVVSDGYVLLADKKAYDKAHKGETLTVGKDAGKKIEGKYPNWKLIARDNTEGYKKAKINVDKLLGFIAGVEDKLKEQWKAEKDAKQTKMSFKDWSSYAEVFVKMPDGSIISFRPQYLKLFAQGMKQIGANEVEYLNIYNKVLATSKNGVALVMPLANYDSWSDDTDVHRYFYDLSEGKAKTKQSWNTNVAESFSNIPNRNTQSQENELSLPNDWEQIPTEDIDNEKMGWHIKGIKTMLSEIKANLTDPNKNYGERERRILHSQQQALEAELDLRERKFEEWKRLYGITKDSEGKKQDRISLEGLTRLFKDINKNKKLDKLFEKVIKVAEQIGLKISFDDFVKGSGSLDILGNLLLNKGLLTSSGYTSEDVASVILHELIHSVTKSTISAYKAGGEKAANLTDSQKKAARKLINEYYNLRNWAVKHGYDPKKNYWMTSPHEMVAEMSNPEFRRFLQSIQYTRRKSFWEVLKDALHGIFSLKETGSADKLLATMLDDLIDNFSMDTFNSMRNQKYNEVWSTTKAVEKTLMGVHNIPEYKLRKVLKQGGLANPSLAVVDTKNHIHTDYGEISLIPRSSLIDARKGRNAGTFTADAWTATYPQVLKKMTNKGWDKFYKDTRAIQKYEDGGQEMYSRIRMAWDNYLDGREPGELYWWYLYDRGYKPTVVRNQNEYGAELTNEITKFMTDEQGNDLSLSSLPDEAIKRIAQLKREYDTAHGEEPVNIQERIYWFKDKMEGKSDVVRTNMQKRIDELEKYGDTLASLSQWAERVLWTGKREGQVSIYDTTLQAQKEVQKNHASDYQAWLLEKEGEYGVQEKLFAGTDDYTGRQKWIPNTLANASKLMKKAGLNGAVGWSSLGEWIAKVATRLTKLEDIRKARKNLNTTKEQHEAFHEKWGNIMHEIAMKIAPGGEAWSGEARMTDALEHANPADYIQREYGINLNKTDRAAIDKFIKEVRENFPTGYFETKFQRPVYLNEFAVAVVPETTSPEIIYALESEGLKITTYQKDQQGNPDDESRRQAVMKAVQDEDDILFRDDDDDEVEPQNDVFYSNAQRAVENVAQEKATPEQWIKMIEKQGGFKAGEDKWLGLRDWLNTAAQEGAKTVNKQQILDYIKSNQIPVEEVTYREYFNMDDNPKMKEFRKEFNEIVEGYKSQLDELDKEMEDFEDKMYEKYGYGWANELNDEEQEIFDAQSEKYNSDPEYLYDQAFREMVNRYGDDFEFAFQVNYNDGTIDVQEDVYSDGISDAAKHFLELNDQPINDIRLNYTTAGLDNKREIAITVPTIEPYNANDEIHFGDAGEGRAVVWVRFGEATVPIKEDVVKHADEFEAPHDNGRGNTLYYPKGTKPGWSKDYIVHGKDKDGKDFYRVVIAEATIGVYDNFEEAQKNMNLYFQNHPKQQTTGTQKVLVIDEIQSKRHQDARDKGYSEAEDIRKKHGWIIEDDTYDPKIFNSNGDRLTTNPDMVGEKDGNHTFVLATDEEWQDVLRYFREKRHGVPSAPFEKNWHELAMKRMLRYAAENGYDKIAWTTGAQQAERYSLSNIVKSIEVGNWGEDVNGDKFEVEQGYKGKSNWVPENDVEKAIKDYIEYCMENGDTFSMSVAYANNQITDAPNESKGWTYDAVLKVADAIEADLTGYKDARGVVINVGDDLIGMSVNRDGKILDSSTTDFVGKSLADVVGNEVALMIVGKEGKGKVDAGDLAIGGEGMKGFYDDILPRFMNKYGKKWGVKVGEIELPDLEESAKHMWSVDITPEMKESVMQGQPLFRLDDEADNNNKNDIIATISDNITPAEVEKAMNSNLVTYWLTNGKSNNSAKRRGWEMFGTGSDLAREMAKARLGINSKWDFFSMFYNPAEHVEEYLKIAVKHGLNPEFAEKYNFRDGNVIQSIINSDKPMYTQDELSEIAKHLKPATMNQFLSAVKAFSDERKIREEKIRLQTYDNGDALTKAFVMYAIAMQRLKDQYEGDERFYKPVTYIKGKNGSDRWTTDTHYYPDYQPKEGEEVETRYELKSNVAKEIANLIATSPVNMKNLKLEYQPMFRLREQEPPKKTGIGYKVFVVKDGKLYPPMVANPNGEATPVNEWLDADAAPITGTSKTGRPQVKAGGKGTQGGSGTLAYRPGWHLGTIPYASQFNRKDAKGDKTLFPKDFVWAEVEYADDVDYSEEARQEGMNANGKYQHSLAGLKRVPENGSYRYRTNPDPNTDEWIITGAMKVNRLLTPSEVDQMVRDAGREPQQRQEGALTDKQVEALNNELGTENRLEREGQEQKPQQVEKKRTAAEQRSRAAFAERQRRRAVETAKDTVKKLNLQDKVTILDNADGLRGRYKKAKGWYDRNTGKIVIVIDNHKSPADVMMTILHEGVAHYGLRKLFGSRFDQFLKNVYEHGAFDIKVEISDMAARLKALDKKYGRTIKSPEQYQMDATEEFLAKLAEDTDFERATNQGWWQQIKQWFIDMCREVGLGDFEGELTDNELRYILWRSYQNLANPSRYRNVFREAELVYNNAVMENKLGVRREKERERLQKTGKTDTSSIAAQAAESGNIVSMTTGRAGAMKRLKDLEKEFKKLDDMMKDKKGRDLDQQFEDAKSEYIKNFGLSGVGKMQADMLNEAIEKFGEEALARRWDLIDEIDALQGQIDDNLFRDGDDAQDIYNEEVSKGNLKFIEAWQDSMIGLKAIQDAIAAETGNVATGAEDAYHFENRMHGRAKNMTEQYDWRFYRPMLKTFNDFCNKHHLTQEQGMEYLVAKSGLERNVFYAFRNAMKKKVAEDLSAEREKLEKDYADGKFAEATYKQMKKDLEEKERTGVDDEMQKVKELLVYKRALEDYQKGDIGYTEYLRRIEKVINANTNGYYEEAARDFSGLTETFAKEQYDAAQKVRKEAQRAIDTKERRALWSEYDSMMREAYNQARQVAEDAVFGAETDVDDTNKLWNAINAATKETLKTSYESGLIDRKNYDKVHNMFEFYIPLRGWDENKAADVYTYMGKDNVFSPAVKKTWGRTSKAENPLAYIGNIAVSTILSGHRNMLKQHFLNYVMNNPTNLVSISESWYENIGTEENPMWILRTADTAGKSADEIAQIVNDFNEEMQQKQAAGLAMPVKGRLRLDVNATKGQKSEHVVEVQRAGHTYQLYINGDPKAAQALNGTNSKAVNRISDTWVGKSLADLNRSMAMFFTSKNPAFVISNLSRDLNMAGASVAIKESPEYNAKFIANVGKVLTPRLAAGDFSREGIKAVIGKGKGVTGMMPKLMEKWKSGKLNESNDTERYFKEFMDEGGETGFVNMLSVDSFKEKMKKEIKEMNSSTLLGSGVKETSVGKALRLMGETFEFYNRCAEDATRFIVYMTSRQMGKTLEESIADAKDVTLNFNRKGTGDKGNAEIRDLFIFVNPAIQALANMYRMMKGHPLRFGGVTLGFVVGGIMVPMINKWLINMFGDDDDKEAYWNLPPWVRKNNLVMWIPFTDSFVTIPLAQEFRVFYGIGEMISSYILKHPHSNNGLEIIDSLADLVPINPMGNGGNLIVDFSFTGVQPIMQLAFNTDFTGKPIWKDNQGNKYNPAYTKAYVSTPKAMVKLSKAVNDITGGDDESQGWLERTGAGAYINNPAVWNHLLQGYFGGMYNTISKSIDATTSLAQGEVPELYRIPVVNRFLNSPAERDNAEVLGEQYWNLVDEHDRFMHDLRAWQRREADGDEKAKEYVNDLLKSDEFKRALVIDHYKNLIDIQRKGEKAAVESADKADIKETITMLHDAMTDELLSIDGGKDPMEAARERFDSVKSFAEKNAIRQRIENILQRGEPKQKIKTRDEVVKKALEYREQDDEESRNVNEKYLMLASSSDIEQDAQLKALKKKVNNVINKYKKLTKENKLQEAAKYREDNQRWFTAERLISTANKQIESQKKMLGHGKDYDMPIMKMIRSRRKWILDNTKDLQEAE